MRIELSPSNLFDFLSDPMGRFVAGKTYLVFCTDLNLRGHVVWGSPTVEEMSEMVRALGVAARDIDTPYRWLVDLRDLSYIEPRSFQLMVDFVRNNADILSRNVIRQAQLRPPGMLGAIISGFSAIARLPYSERVFDDVSAAFDWLGLERRQGIELLEQLTQLRARQTTLDPRINQFQALVDSNPATDAALAASNLRLSKRQLQRLLAESGTTFRSEVMRARLLKAKTMLAQADAKLSFVATSLGFSAPQHFSTWFKKVTGESPTEWRRRTATSEPTAPVNTASGIEPVEAAGLARADLEQEDL